jgi:hypothetical protein
VDTKSTARSTPQSRLDCSPFRPSAAKSHGSHDVVVGRQARRATNAAHAKRTSSPVHRRQASGGPVRSRTAFGNAALDERRSAALPASSSPRVGVQAGLVRAEPVGGRIASLRG